MKVAAPVLASLVIALATSVPAAAQGVVGKPLIYNFDRTAVGAEVQHWDAVQDHRGVVYFANNSGVLEFDGRSWRLIELPSRVAVRHLTVAPDGKGRIYVGAVGDFGYLEANAAGQLRFVSLRPPEANADLSFDQVFMPVMVPNDGNVYFQGKTKTCHITTAVQCHDSEHSTTMFSAGGKLFVHQPTRGLMELVDGSPRPIVGGEQFAGDEITVVLSAPAGDSQARLLVGTRDVRFFMQSDRGFEPFAIDVSRRSVGAEADQLVDGVVLPDGSLALATLLRGLLIVDPAGRLLRQIDKGSGLLDNHVLAVQPDRQNGVWLALQNGVSRVDLSPTFSVFDESAGLEREWREAIEHDGRLYVRGYKGLYAATLPARRFERIVDVKPPVWAFVAAEERLVAAAQDGIYEVRGTSVRRIVTYPTMPMALHRSRHDRRRFYVGLEAGVASLRLEGDRWHDEGRIAGLNDTITSIGDEANGDLWLVSQRQRVIRVSMDPDRDGPRIHAYPLGEQALTGRIGIYEVAGRAVFLTDRWILEFDASSERFVPFSGMSTLADAERRSFSWLTEDSHGNLWVASRQPARVDLLRKEGDGRYVLDNDGLRQAIAWSIYPEAHGSIVWISTPEYLLRYDRSIDSAPQAPFATLLRSVTVNDTVVYSGASGVKTADAAFRHGSNALQFEFAAPRFDDAERNEFQSYLEGFDAQWSAWTTVASRVYASLPKGAYRFHVRSRDVQGRVGDTATFAFSILPPWYQTGWAYALYGVALVACLVVISAFERRRAQAKLGHQLEHMELEKLRDLDRLKSRFFADISHEFRTPLTLILGPVGQMLDEATHPQAVRPLRMIRRHAQYLLRLVSQLLDLSKLESRKMRLHATRGDLMHVLEQIVTPFAPVAERHGIEFQFGASAQPQALARFDIYFDSDVLQKILNNLIGNALKFTPSGGAVSVDVHGPQNGLVDIVVSDTGVGIPEAELPLVFERFYQVERSRAREGIGIGLALVKELVDLHHGEIHVESQEGKGTTFIIRLHTGRAHLAPEEIVESRVVPALETQLTSATNLEVDGLDDDPAVDEAVEEPDDETTILIVEDHADVRTFLREHLQRHYRVVEAQHGSEGLEKALALLPDLVLSDVVMPQMDGYELCRALKTNEQTCHIPVVLLTAKTMREDKLFGLETGADCYLMKPFDALELLVQVRNLINQRRQLRERFSGPVVLKPAEMGVTPMDEAFLTKVLTVIQSNLQDASFDVERLGREVGLSRSQLHRKLRALTNQAPTLLIRSIRLQRAAELLAHKTGSVAEIAYFVGFNSQAYFAKCFRDQFGCSPKEYATTTPAKRA